MTRISKIFLMFVCMASAMSGLVVAQQSQGKTVARIVFNQDVSDYQLETDQAQGLQGALEALRQETEQSQVSNRNNIMPSQSNVAPSPSSWPNAAPSPSSWPTQRPSVEAVLLDLRPSLPNPDPDAIDDVGATDDIDERIELLKRIYETKRIENQKKIAESAMSPTPATNKIPTSERPAVPVSTPLSTQMNAQETGKVPPGVERIFPDPVNAFELGNSLYYTGDLKTAMGAYSKVDRNQITAVDAVWLDFMIASCYRRLGNWDEAIGIYRDIANQNVAPNLSKPAQLWLKQLELTSRAKTSLQQMESEISSLIETAKKHVKQ